MTVSSIDFAAGECLRCSEHRPYRIIYPIAIASVPMHISARPIAAFRDNFSFKKRSEKRTVMRILILSIGTTTLRTPFCTA